MKHFLKTKRRVVPQVQRVWQDEHFRLESFPPQCLRSFARARRSCRSCRPRAAESFDDLPQPVEDRPECRLRPCVLLVDVLLEGRRYPAGGAGGGHRDPFQVGC